MIQGYVYLIESELGIYKIGRTKNVAARISQLKALPFKIELVHSIACEDDLKCEQELHEKFKDKMKTGEWYELNKEDIEFLKSIEYIEANPQAFEIIKLSKEQQINLFEILQKYAEQKEGLASSSEININHPELIGEIATRSFRTYTVVLDRFAEFCKGRKEQQKDLFALALIDFIESHN